MSDRTCDVVGCNADSERSLNIKKVLDTDLELKDPECRNVHLCKAHYKEWKKQSKGSIPDYLGSV